MENPIDIGLTYPSRDEQPDIKHPPITKSPTPPTKTGDPLELPDVLEEQDNGPSIPDVPIQEDGGLSIPDVPIQEDIGQMPEGLVVRKLPDIQG